MQPMAVETTPIANLRPYAKNARTHSKKQIRQIAESIKEFGFTNPILISDDDEIIAGHGRVEAAGLIGLKEVPTLRLSHLNAAQRRAYIIADNKLALNAGWDREVLADELQTLIDIDFDVEIAGFSLAEVDILLDDTPDSAQRERNDADDEILYPPERQFVVTRPLDLWLLDRHRLICGDTRYGNMFDLLMADERADLVFTDPPYNLPTGGSGRDPGRTRRPEFASGVGDMSKAAFTAFLREGLGHCAARCRDGAIAFVCMDWRHMGELLSAGEAVFSGLTNLCVWNKTNEGAGSFYASNHELVFVFKVGDAPHTFGPGDTGRSNVWDYAGINTEQAAATGALAKHPAVKPIALVADAIKDGSRPGGIVLDPFGGSGTTLMAAERTGRLSRLIEPDPGCCDQIIRRFEKVTGKRAVLAATGQCFEAVAEQRSVPPVGQNQGEVVQ